MSHKGLINVGKEKVDVPFLMKNGQKVLRIQKEIPAESNKKERKEPKAKQSHIMKLTENKHVTESKWRPVWALI